MEYDIFKEFVEIINNHEIVINTLGKNNRINDILFLLKMICNYYKNNELYFSTECTYYYYFWLCLLILNNINNYKQLEITVTINIKFLINILFLNETENNINLIQNSENKQIILNKQEELVQKRKFIVNKITIIIKAFRLYKLKKFLLIKYLLKRRLPNEIVDKIIDYGCV